MTDEPRYNAHIFRNRESHAKVTVTGDALEVHMGLASMFGHHTPLDWQALCAVAPASFTLPTGHRLFIDPA